MAEPISADRGELATVSEADMQVVDGGSLRLLCVDDNATPRYSGPLKPAKQRRRCELKKSAHAIPPALCPHSRRCAYHL